MESNVNILIEYLKLKNFKGTKEFELTPKSTVTSLFGENGTGKTTVIDAFTYLLWDKDSQDRADFEIKTLDENGQAIHYLEHEVEGRFLVNGMGLTLRKVYKEDWSTPRGKAVAEFKGHKTLYYINDIPVKKAEFKAKIAEIITEDKFKLLTNPYYFSNNLKWQQAREILITIAGGVDDKQIFERRNDLEGLSNILEGNDVDTLRKQIKEKIKRLKKDKENIPYRIDELYKSLYEEDFEELKKLALELDFELKKVNHQLQSSNSENDEKLEISNRIYDIKAELQRKTLKAKEDHQKSIYQVMDKRNKVISVLATKGQELRELDRDLLRIRKDKANLENTSLEMKNKLEKLRVDFKNVTNLVNTHCPTCKQPLPEGDITKMCMDMKGNINNEGKILKNQYLENVEKIKELSFLIADEEVKVRMFNEELEELNRELSGIDEEINIANTHTVKIEGKEELLNEIKSLEEKQKSFTIDNNKLELKSRREKLQNEIFQVRSKLGREDVNKATLGRIEELKTEEKSMAELIATLQGQDFMCEEFIRTKVELIEGNINKLFDGKVSFKLFNQQINGGLEECCEALIDGVPFSNANTASKVNAGLAIINVLSKHYGITAPIFIDNREGVNEVIPVESQLINLYVSKDKKLRIE